MAESSPVTLTTRDGFSLAARHFRADAAIATIVIGAATGVPQGFYKRFADHASARGFDVITTDYRGIGLSAPKSLRGFRMDYLDWSRYDLAAAVDYAAGLDRPLVLVGHSLGAHAIGLLPNHSLLRAAYLCAGGAGWHGWMPKSEQIKVQLMWSVIGPVLTGTHGYLAWSKLGLGEDLPIDVFRQWRHWCRYPNYFFGDPAMAETLKTFAEVRIPIKAVNALDDLWAPPASRDAFMAGYRNASVETQDLDPAMAGMGPIGHMGYFRPAAQPLWDEMLVWLKARLD